MGGWNDCDLVDNECEAEQDQETISQHQQKSHRLLQTQNEGIHSVSSGLGRGKGFGGGGGGGGWGRELGIVYYGF